MTEAVPGVAEQSAQILDQLTAAAGIATALLQTMVELRRQPVPMQQLLEQVRTRDTPLHATIETLKRELAEAREQRDKAEAVIVQQRQDIALLQKLSRECKGFVERKGKRRGR